MMMPTVSSISMLDTLLTDKEVAGRGNESLPLTGDGLGMSDCL